MVGLAIVAGVFAFLLIGAYIGEEVVHNPYAGLAPGAVAGLWAAWPFMHFADVQRSTFLHPIQKEYRVSAKQAFAIIRELLAELSYNFGDRWQVVTTDTMAGRIAARLSFVDQHVHYEADPSGVHERRENLQRFISLEALINSTNRDSAIIQLDFNTQAEGLEYNACDSIISDFRNMVDNRLGGGVEVGAQPDTRLHAPPWWLLGVTAWGLLILWQDVQKAVFQ